MFSGSTHGMACLSTSPFLWLCGNNAFPLCSPHWWTSDCSQLSATVTGGTEHWCLSNGLSSSFPCLSTYQGAQLSNHVGLLFKLFSSLFKQTFNQHSSFGPKLHPPQYTSKGAHNTPESVGVPQSSVCVLVCYLLS